MRHYFGTAACAAVGFFIFASGVATVPTWAQPAPIVTKSMVTTTATAGETNTDSQAPSMPLPTPSSTAVDQSAAPQAPSVSQPTTLAAMVEEHRGAVAPDEEGKCLATAIYFESKGEPLVGQLAVAQVMINRTQSGRFPATLCAVVRQPSQFSFVRHGAFPYIAESSKAWHTALAIAEIARGDMWQPVVGRAMFFHAKRVSPHWHVTQVASLGNHLFYR